MLQLLIDAWGDRPPPSLRCILYGAAPMPPALLARLTEAWNCDFVNGYGSTEAMGISFLTPTEHRQVERLSVGRSSTVVSSLVTDDTGREIPANEVGEVRARGATLMSGYWRRPQETDEAIADGWLRTGDLGYRDGDGFLHLVDRRNDKIITGGENVFPSEVEDAIAVHPDVAEAAVIGVPDLKWGEAVVASVVLHEEAAVDEQGLKAHCREMLAPYKVPKVIRISVDPLPRTATGKLLRREVRAGWSS
jgi:long-chain acyl-CoA synthetase